MLKGEGGIKQSTERAFISLPRVFALANNFNKIWGLYSCLEGISRKQPPSFQRCHRFDWDHGSRHADSWQMSEW